MHATPLHFTSLPFSKFQIYGTHFGSSNFDFRLTVCFSFDFVVKGAANGVSSTPLLLNGQ